MPAEDPLARREGTAPGTGSYRPHVDGLRAVAVLAVVAFHLRENRIPGGFAGVDVFFVLSGFLITSQILLDMAAGRFSYPEFYRRRIRRIAPAMLATIFASVVAAQILLLPEDAVATAWSGLWAMAGLANVWFWQHLDTSYFAEDSATVPLLHLWSLGIEEQFYLVWPPVLLWLGRHGRLSDDSAGAGLAGDATSLSLLTAGGVGSFLLGSALAPTAPTFAYYMLPTRAGELLLGALIAIHARAGLAQRIGRSMAEWLGAAGLVIITVSFFRLSGEDPYPGLLALPPTLGTALVVLSGEAHPTLTARALSLRPMVEVGLRSYAIYLWHWPLIAFWRYGYGSVGRVPTVGILAATSAAAWSTHRWIEEPARQSKASAGRVLSSLFALPACAVLLAVAFALRTDGFGPRSFADDYLNALTHVRDSTRTVGESAQAASSRLLAPGDDSHRRRVFGPAGGRDAGLLWGDSNAAHYIGLISAFADAEPFRFRHLSVVGCPGVLDEPGRFASTIRRDDCERSSSALRSALEGEPTVMMASRWSKYVGVTPDFLEAVFTTAETIRATGARVILLGETPAMTGFDPRCLEKALSYPRLDCGRWERFPIDPRTTAVNRRLRSFADRTPGVTYWDPNEALCPAGSCSAFDSDGEPLFRDPSHLSPAGSRAVGDAIVRATGVPDVFREGGSGTNAEGTR